MYYSRVQRGSEALLRQRVLELFLQSAQELDFKAGDPFDLQGSSLNGSFMYLIHRKLHEDIHYVLAHWGYGGITKYYLALPYDVKTQQVIDEVQAAEMLQEPKLSWPFNPSAQQATAYDLIQVLPDLDTKWIVVQQAAE